MLPPLAIVCTNNPSAGPFLYINYDYTEYACYIDCSKIETVLPTEA